MIPLTKDVHNNSTTMEKAQSSLNTTLAVNKQSSGGKKMSRVAANNNSLGI